MSFKPTFPLSFFTFINRLFSSSSLSAGRVVSSAYLRLLIFLPAILIPACASSIRRHYEKLAYVIVETKSSHIYSLSFTRKRPRKIRCVIHAKSKDLSTRVYNGLNPSPREEDEMSYPSSNSEKGTKGRFLLLPHFVQFRLIGSYSLIQSRDWVLFTYIGEGNHANVFHRHLHRHNKKKKTKHVYLGTPWPVILTQKINVPNKQRGNSKYWHFWILLNLTAKLQNGTLGITLPPSPKNILFENLALDIMPIPQCLN